MWQRGRSRVDSATVENQDSIVDCYVKRGELDFRVFAARSRVEES